MPSIADNLIAVRKRIAAAAEQAGRDVASIKLLAVSKTKPVAYIEAAYAEGQRDFGENYAQELLQKAEALAHLRDIRWHMIGQLQRNKAKHVARVASALHTVDSTRLALELNRRLANTTRLGEGRLKRDDNRLAVFVEVNVAGESQKAGCEPTQLGPLLEQIEALPQLKLVGLMTVPPRTEDPTPRFQQLRRLRDQWGGEQRLPELSMGMSHDLNAAIITGATWVRVGTAIFGKRSPKAQAS